MTVHRSDSSGDTFLFTSFLSDTDPSGWGAKYSYNTSITFPAIPGRGGGREELGDALDTCEPTKGCIAYIGISYLDKALSAGLGEAELQNKSGTFELPTSADHLRGSRRLSRAHSFQRDDLDDLRSAPTGYPIVNYEYAIVSGQAVELAGRCGHPGVPGLGDRPLGRATRPRYLDQVHFVALPSAIVNIAVNQLNKIS